MMIDPAEVVRDALTHLRGSEDIRAAALAALDTLARERDEAREQRDGLFEAIEDYALKAGADPMGNPLSWDHDIKAALTPTQEEK